MYIVTNQLEFSQGTRRDQGELLTDAEQVVPPTVIQKKGSLYLILEPDNLDRLLNENELDFARNVQQIILQEYYNYPGSTVTSAMRTALEKANQFIFNINSKLLPAERRGFGLSCAVVRGPEMYLAQLPPTQAILVHQGQLKYFPTPADRIPGPRAVAASTAQTTPPAAANAAAQITNPSNPRRSAQPSLGRYATIELNLMRNVFEEGNVLIFVSTGLIRALRNEQTERIFLKQDGRSALYSLADWMRAEHIANGYTLAVSALSEYAVNKQAGTRKSHTAGLPPSNANKPQSSNSVEEYDYDDGADDQFKPLEQRRSLQPDPLSTATTVNPVVGRLEETPRDSGDPWLRREQDLLQQPPYLRGRLNDPFQPVSASSQAPQPSQPAAPPASNVQKPPTQPNLPAGSAQSTPARNFTTVGQQAGSVQPPPAQASFEPASIKRGQPQARLEFEKKATAPHAAINFEQPFQQTVAQNRPRRTFGLLEFLQKRRGWLIGGVAVLLVAIVAIVFVLNTTKINQHKEAALKFIQQAEASRETADQLASSTDPTQLTQARTIIDQARTDLDKAKVEQADNPNIAPEQLRLQQTLDRINRVSVPTDMRLVYDLSSLGAGVKIEQSVLTPNGDVLFLLDKGRGTVYQLDLTGQNQPKTILKVGDTVNGRAFDKPVAMANRLDSIVVVDVKNVAWIYNRSSSSWSGLVLGGSTTWTGQLRGIATYDGGLYVIGPDNGQILRYAAGSYQASPDEWLDPTAVSQANVDRAAVLNIDGNIYIMGSDGKLVVMARPAGKSTGQIVQQANEGGNLLSPALNGPLALNPVNYDFPYFFVVDSENRLLKFKKSDGSFVQQLQAATGNTEFDKLRDVAVDVKNNRIYIVGEQKVYSFALTQASNSPSVTGSATVTTAATGAVTTPEVSPTLK